MVVIVSLGVVAAASAAAYIHRSGEPDSASFAVIADYGSGNSVQAAVAGQLAQSVKKKQARFVLALGNNFLDDGVSNRTDKLWDSRWRKPYYGTGKLAVPWYPVLGVSDYRGNSSAQIGTRQNWDAPDRNFVIEVHVPGSKPVYVLMLDTTPMVHPNGLGATSTAMAKELQARTGSDAVEWLRSVLHTVKGNTVIVAGHHPIRVHVSDQLGTVSSGRYKAGAVNPGMEPVEQLLHEHKVAAYFGGHLPIMDCITHDGVDYWTAGVGGCSHAQPYPCSLDGETVLQNKANFAARRAGFMMVDLSSRWIDVSFVDAKGTILFTKSMPRSSN